MYSGANRWLTYRRELPDPRLRLFCFSGGGASTFITWSQGMPTGVEVCPIQVPGRENRIQEPPITNIPQLVARVMEVVVPLLDRPFALFGHSVGALTIFELARELRREGLVSPVQFFASGHPAPDLPQRRPPVSHLPPPEFWRMMKEQFAMDPVLLANEDLKSFLYPALRADYELLETYVYEEEPPFDFPLSVLGGATDPETTELELLAWKKHTTQRFNSRILEGNHNFIKTGRGAFVRALAQDLEQTLASA